MIVCGIGIVHVGRNASNVVRFGAASDAAEIVASRFNQGRLSLASVDDMHNASACGRTFPLCPPLV